jgi:8-oxo-dGTP diphosphatase
MNSNSGRQRVVAAVIERDGSFLLCKRPLLKRHGGLWEFPGGKVEPGEGLAQAVKRELLEELNLIVTELGSVHMTLEDPGSAFSIVFVNVLAEGEPEAFEHTEIRWVAKKALLELPLAPSDERFAQYLNGPTHA